MRLARLRDEDGFTVVEGVVAAMIFAIAAIAVLSAFDGARRATYRAEQSQVANEVAQRELEALRSKSYSQLAMTSAPAAQPAETDPRHRVSGTTFQLTEGDSGSAAQMVIEGGSLTGGGTVAGGTVNPGPVPFTSGDVSGTIHRFIVWRNDPNCLPLLCPGAQDLKRAVVAVTIDSSPTGGGERYVELQSDMIDPDESIASNPNLPLLGDPTVAQQFWLSDQRCQTTDEPATSSTLTSHALRNTFGLNCSSSTTNRPDALLTEAPTNLNSTHDFATDLEPTPPTADSGLQFQVPDANGCTLRPSGTNGYRQQHVWVSRRLNGTAAYQLSGGATLKLWARSINDIVTPAKLCVVLFQRTEVELLGVLGATTDTTIASQSPSYTSWPSNGWEELTVQLPYNALTLPRIGSVGNILHQRIGLAIGLEKSGSPSDQVMIQYDNLELESRLEVETTTPIGLG